MFRFSRIIFCKVRLSVWLKCKFIVIITSNLLYGVPLIEMISLFDEDIVPLHERIIFMVSEWNMNIYFPFRFWISLWNTWEYHVINSPFTLSFYLVSHLSSEVLVGLTSSSKAVDCATTNPCLILPEKDMKLCKKKNNYANLFITQRSNSGKQKPLPQLQLVLTCLTYNTASINCMAKKLGTQTIEVGNHHKPTSWVVTVRQRVFLSAAENITSK